MSFLSMGLLFNSITSFILCFFVFFKNKNNKLSISWALTCFFVGLWAIGLFFVTYTSNHEHALFWVKVHYAGAFFIPSCFMFFILNFLKQEEQNKKLIFVVFFMSSVFFLANFFNLISKGVSIKYPGNFYTDPGIFFSVFILEYFLVALIAHFFAIRSYKNLDRNKKKQLGFILIGSIIGFLGGGTTVLPVYGIKVYPFGASLVFLYTVFVTYSITKHELMDIKIFISKGIAYVLTIGTAFVGWVFICFSSNNIKIIAWGNLALLIFFIFFAEKIRNIIQSIPDALLFKPRYNYEEIKQIFSNDFEKTTNLQELFNTLECLFGFSIQVWPVSFYIPNNFEEQSVPLKEYIKWSLQSKAECSEKTIEIDSVLIRKILDEKDVVFYNDSDKETKKALDDLDSDCVIPSVYNGQVTCLVVISKDKKRPINDSNIKSNMPVFVSYTPMDKVLFNLISKQMVIVLNRLRPYEKLQADYKKSLKIAEQATMHRAFAEFTKKIHHEIKNPLHSLALNTGHMKSFTNEINLKEMADTIHENKKDEFLEYIEDLNDYMRDAESSVKHINKITDTMSKYAYIKDDNKFILKGEHTKTVMNINQSIDDTIRLSKAVAKEKKIAFDINLDPNIPNVLSSKELLNQIFLNIFLNAIQAMDKGGKLTIKTSKSKFLDKNQKEVEGIRVDVTDNGEGMTNDELERIYEPLYTTKHDGTGLGLSVVFNSVDEHGGIIDATSQKGIGTTFSIYFPEQKEFS